MIDLDRTGSQIGKKIFVLLTEKQRKELIEYMLKVGINSITETFRHVSESKQNVEIKDTLTEISFGDMYFCLEQRMVTIRKKIIKLTVKEFDLLALLIMHPKRVFTYEMIMDLVWHEDYTFYSRKAVNNHVSNLRKKLKIAPDVPDYVKSVYGVGYKFEV